MKQTFMEDSIQWIFEVLVEDNNVDFSVSAGSDIVHFMNDCFDIPLTLSCTLS